MLNKKSKDELFEKAALIKRLEVEIERIKTKKVELKNQLMDLRATEQEIELQVGEHRQSIKKTMLENNKSVLRKAGEYTLKVKRSTVGSVVIHNEELLPERFKKIAITFDKASIRKEINEGQPVNGAELEFKPVLYITK